MGQSWPVPRSSPTRPPPTGCRSEAGGGALVAVPEYQPWPSRRFQLAEGGSVRLQAEDGSAVDSIEGLLEVDESSTLLVALELTVTVALTLTLTLTLTPNLTLTLTLTPTLTLTLTLTRSP